MDDLPKRTIEQIEYHFNHYKDFKKPCSTKVKGFFGVDEAVKIIEAATIRYR
jgi:inorganic pyrophosphatase